MGLCISFCIGFTIVVGCSRLCAVGCSVILLEARVVCVVGSSLLTCREQRCLYCIELIL